MVSYKSVGLLGLGVLIAFLPNQSLHAASTPEKKSEITRHDITWKFDKAYPTGQFVNGDPWVLGPVKIVSVTPGWDGEVHGTQVDPPVAGKAGQGFRKVYRAGAKYQESLRATFPLKLSGVKSVVSTIGMKPQRKGGAYEAFETASVLTVVKKIPVKKSFRPPYIAGKKPIYTAAQIQWKRLPKLKPPAGFKPPTKNPMERLWMDHSGTRGQANGTIHPRKNMSPYYFFMSLSATAQVLLIDFPKRKELLYSYMQYGIDNYHISLHNGDAWRAYGGFGNGRKWPILFTGILLDVKKMQHPPKTCKAKFSRTGTVGKFGEDGHTYFGKLTKEYPKGKPLWGQDAPAGMWFQNHDNRDPEGILEPRQLPKEKPSLGGGYRWLCSKGWAGPALAARLMGAKELWGHDAFFAYVDRWIKEEAPKAKKDLYSYGPAPVKAMWLKYRKKADKIGKKYQALRKK